MSRVERTKLALDDARTLMLGAQILLGFQLQAPFQKAYALISHPEKAASLAVLLVMVAVVGLLVAPSARHRIVHDGEASEAFNRFVTRVSLATLAPFALAFGLAIGLAIARILGPASSVTAGAAATLGAASLWYGPLLSSHARRKHIVADIDDRTPLSAKIEYVLTESRVVLPGAQALLGFQLAIVLTSAFADMTLQAKVIHGLAIGLIAIATALLIVPAVYHRIVFDGADDPRFHRVASRVLLVATLVLALGLASDIYVVSLKILESEPVAAAVAIACAAALLSLWLAWPWWVWRSRMRRSQA